MKFNPSRNKTLGIVRFTLTKFGLATAEKIFFEIEQCHNQDRVGLTKGCQEQKNGYAWLIDKISTQRYRQVASLTAGVRL